MKAFFTAVLLLTVIAISIPGQSQAALVDKIKAIVNNEVITQSEVDRLLYPIYLRYKDIYKGNKLNEKLEEASNEILDELIEDRLLLSEAKRLNIQADEEEVDDRIKQLKMRFSGEDDFNRMLSDQNLSIKDFRTRYREQIMVEKLIDREIRYQIQILPQEAESYYREHIDEFKEPEQVKVSSILVRLKSKRTPEQTLALVVNLLQRLQNGDDFYTLAKMYSEGTNAEGGGDMGYVRKGQMIDKIDKVIFNLKIGEFSDLVETSLGYHIFKVYDRKKGRIIPLAEARPRITDELYREKVEKKFAKWMKGLRENAFISIK